MISLKLGDLRNAALLIVVLLLVMVPIRVAYAGTESVLYNFCSVPPNCADGYTPYSGLISGKGGYYGTSAVGGAYNNGVVYKVTTKGKQTVVHSFASFVGDGIYPYGGLMKDSVGNLYGTTFGGGANGYGTIYKISTTGVETVIYNFCSQPSCTDGAYPLYPVLIKDTAGNLYGTTSAGGTNGKGTVFELTVAGKEMVLYSFCDALNCPDGASPNAGVIRDGKGNLYGTTPSGGAYGYGTVFKVGSSGGETVLHSFSGYPNDGSQPIAGLIRDSKGNLYGTTTQGGVSFMGGTVFKVTAKGVESVLYSFCSQPSCSDGTNPSGGLIVDKLGNFYGTTRGGGLLGGWGTVFELSATGTETVLYDFCSQTNCTDGAAPFPGVIRDSLGNLYGTAQQGGANGNGVVFKLTP